MFTRILWSVLPAIALLLIISGLWHRLTTVTAERDQARQQINILSNDINAQNLAIKKWQQQAAIQAQKLQRAEANEQQQNKIYQAAIKQLDAAKVPVNCSAAVNWGAIEAQRLSKQWNNH